MSATPTTVDTALCSASERGDILLACHYLREGANVHAYDSGALRWASRDGHASTVSLLLEHGALVHARDDFALRVASKNGHVEVVRVLIEHGANICAMDNGALKWACEYGQYAVAELLLQHGAVAGRDHVRRVCTIQTKERKRAMIALLQRHGVKVDPLVLWANRSRN